MRTQRVVRDIDNPRLIGEGMAGVWTRVGWNNRFRLLRDFFDTIIQKCLEFGSVDGMFLVKGCTPVFMKTTLSRTRNG